MDLGAYIQIKNLDSLAQANGIIIPRLRGYRLMEYESPMDNAVIAEMFHNCEVDAVRKLCASLPFWDSKADCRIYNSRTDYLRNYYTRFSRDNSGERTPIGIRWDRIHGKKRRILKFEIKKKKKRIIAQYSLWNKYAGQKNILYIHSRMGGGNWIHYEGKDLLTSQPWFLDRVDDWWDGTYCDFYAKLDPAKTNEGNNRSDI